VETSNVETKAWIIESWPEIPPRSSLVTDANCRATLIMAMPYERAAASDIEVSKK
jgi:hypothetical protein